MTDRMEDVDHTHPHTGQPFGAVYRRGPTAADGGSNERRARMKDVNHTPPHGDDANAVWERGEERDDASDAERERAVDDESEQAVDDDDSVREDRDE